MKNGKMMISPKGHKYWMLKGKFHRTDGPAIEWVDGTKEWWLNDINYGENIPSSEYELHSLLYEGLK